MTVKKRGATFKGLGISVHDDIYGRLRLVQKLPETGEIFILRERSVRPNRGISLLLPPGMRREIRENRRLNLLRRRENGGETLVGHATYVPLLKSDYLWDIETFATHKKRGIASSLLAYMKTRGKDIWLNPSQRAKPFYERLGFERSAKYGALALPAAKPLATRAGERVRKFMITGKKK